MLTSQNLYLHAVKSVSIGAAQSAADPETGKTTYWRDIVIEYDGGTFTVAMLPKNRFSEAQLKVNVPAALV